MFLTNSFNMVSAFLRINRLTEFADLAQDIHVSFA